MKYVIAILGFMAMASFAMPQAALADHEGKPHGKSDHHVTSTETHVEGDLNALKSHMSHLQDQEDALHVRMDALQKQIDAAQDTADKLSK